MIFSKKNILIIVIIICGVVFYGVYRQLKTPRYSEGLSPEVMEKLDKTPESSLPENQVILPNGQNLSDYKKSRGL